MEISNRPRVRQYATWYEFKKDLEKRLGHVLLNWDWLEVKPRDPLPWDESHLRAAIGSILFRRSKALTMDIGYSRRQLNWSQTVPLTSGGAG